MLSEHLKRIIQANPEYTAITPVIEKEILHHDIMDVLVTQGAMQSLTFIGGTSLRMCYNSSRLSEDLDFNGGFNFKPSDFDGLELDIKQYIEKKYETDVYVGKPSAEAQGDTSSWKISIEKEPNRPDLPRQKMHIDVCAIPSFESERRPLVNHYNLVVPTEGLLIPVQSLNEALADKLIALAYRSRRIKPRDVWDIAWLKQKGVTLSSLLIDKKLDARGKNGADFKENLAQQVNRLLTDDEVRVDFINEISRFVPSAIKARTLDNPDYWPYVKNVVQEISAPLFSESATGHPFDMGM
ncbi:nucleotidyl transferase AbiEii/AbiGii toxin family protein [Neiella marina]|uniref:Nucleotidyl transferase AbiEii/AbiGii toxin family protein n=1 Tax=Neiella holothuriorum TaxID=2870530 RepID=A0ABS7EI60_9GAMM|nr:nucleotidyl transferase AbiEii/AbiGii toxin family protein [Neiella holothuriorum]MBW8191441.1 nucleotidyl transferase AbiEii/AbiGii toxin family protein [Neiella holothuriorum]